jgi:hypothetical protein
LVAGWYGISVPRVVIAGMLALLAHPASRPGIMLVAAELRRTA